MARRVLAFDFGASSGRAMIGTYADGRIELKEIHRFSNDPVELNGTLYWDVLRLFFEIKQGIVKAKLDGGFDAIGIDTWGVDFGLLDREGNLLQNPVHYRDLRTEGMIEEVCKILPKEKIFEITGSQFLRLNTLYQMYYLNRYKKDLIDRTESMLFMPDLFAYFLTGVKKAEYSIASTSQMMDVRKGTWAFDMLKELGIETRILPEIMDAGEVYGTLSPKICDELGVDPVPVVAVCTHDTGSAVAAVPTQADKFCYVSSGTWSLFGTELHTPVVTPECLKFNLTNEGGYGRSVRLLKNIMGLWLIQESRRQWIREGLDASFNYIEQEALKAKPFQSFIDPDDPDFEMPGNLPKRIQDYCIRTHQYVPQGVGEVARVIYQSLALKYRYVLEGIQSLCGTKFEVLHLVGGGGKDKLLSQMAADACNLTVMAGPTEATALGNVGVQLLSLGDFKDLKSVRKAIAAGGELKTYLSNNDDEWEDAYRRFREITRLA